jgi:hypothetical protein
MCLAGRDSLRCALAGHERTARLVRHAPPFVVWRANSRQGQLIIFAPRRPTGCNGREGLTSKDDVAFVGNESINMSSNLPGLARSMVGSPSGYACVP